MGSSISGVATQFDFAAYSSQLTVRKDSQGISIQKDELFLGMSGTVDAKQAIEIVTERAMAKLQSVVGEAREALGLPEGKTLDLSPEATADRIVEFALNFFENFRANNDFGEDSEDARQAFIDLIGPAIQQGIDEARGILESLQALTPEATGKIDAISALIQERLDAFLTGA